MQINSVNNYSTPSFGKIINTLENAEFLLKRVAKGKNQISDLIHIAQKHEEKPAELFFKEKYGLLIAKLSEGSKSKTFVKLPFANTLKFIEKISDKSI